MSLSNDPDQTKPFEVRCEVGYKAFRRELFEKIRLQEDKFGFEPEFTAKVARLSNIRIYEVPISYYGRSLRRRQESGLARWRRGYLAYYKIQLF
jgi:hypothetical protein